MNDNCRQVMSFQNKTFFDFRNLLKLMTGLIFVTVVVHVAM